MESLWCVCRECSQTAFQRVVEISKTPQDVSTKLKNNLTETQCENRVSLLKIMSCLRYSARQGLPFRGHRDEKDPNFKQLLKQLRNCILRTSLVWSLVYSIRAYASLYLLPILLENFFFFLSVLFVITACSKFDVIFINFCNICITIIYVVGVTCFCSHLSRLTFKQFVRTDTRHENLIIALNKNMPPGSF